MSGKLCICTGSPKLLLLYNERGVILSCAGSFMVCAFYRAFIAQILKPCHLTKQSSRLAGF